MLPSSVATGRFAIASRRSAHDLYQIHACVQYSAKLRYVRTPRLHLGRDIQYDIAARADGHNDNDNDGDSKN